MKHCRWCSQDKPLREFYRHPEMADGHLNKCKECVRRYAVERRLTSDRPREIDRRRFYEGGKREYNRQRSKAHPQPTFTHRARSAVAYAIKTGRLCRPDVCEWCSEMTFCEAAHRDYSKPLDVTWLCRRCHRRWDTAEPKSKVAPG